MKHHTPTLFPRHQSLRFLFSKFKPATVFYVFELSRKKYNNQGKTMSSFEKGKVLATRSQAPVWQCRECLMFFKNALEPPDGQCAGCFVSHFSAEEVRQMEADVDTVCVLLDVFFSNGLFLPRKSFQNVTSKLLYFVVEFENREI
jgi:hypothetical protein